jgi:hypothetical protein
LDNGSRGKAVIRWADRSAQEIASRKISSVTSLQSGGIVVAAFSKKWHVLAKDCVNLAWLESIEQRDDA